MIAKENILKNAPFGYALHKIVLDDLNVPVDYEFIEVNNAFEKLTGLQQANIIGQLVTAVLPDIKNSNFDWIGFYGKVALEETEATFEQFFEPLGKYYNVQVYAPQKEYFITIFSDISAQKSIVTPDEQCIPYRTAGSHSDISESKKMEAVLKENEIRLELAMDAGDYGFWDWNLLTDETYFNTRYFTMLGDAVKELPMKTETFTKLIHPDDKPEVMLIIQESLKDGSPYVTEFRLLCKDGSYRWIKSKGKFYVDNNKVPYRAIGIHVDIHQRKMAEKSLKESELRFSVAIDGTEAGIWDWNLIDNGVVYSVQWKAMLGYNDAEIENTFEGWKNLWHPDDAVAIEKAINDHLQGLTEKYEIIHRCRHKNGSWHWIMSRGKIINKKGKPYRWIGTHIDITAQKQTEKALNTQTSLQQMLMELSGTYINLPVEQLENTISISLERIGQFIEADRVYLFKYDDEKNTSSNTHEWCNEGIEPQILELQDLPNEMIADMVETTKRGDMMLIPDVMALPEQNSLRQVLEPQGILSLIVIPMMDEGKCTGFAGFDSVKTHRIYGIEEQRLLTVFVQGLVNVSKRQVTENALKSAVLQAQAASTAKSEFLANMSHEIRTPLNGVIGFTDLLKNTQLSEVQQQYVNNANVSGHILLNIINDILDFSKIEAGMLELEVIKTDMIELLENSVDIVKYAASQKQLEILLDIDQTMPRFAMVDPIRLTQILANLLGNAVKFTEKGEVKLKVVFQELNAGQGKLSFSVHDTGIGISEVQKKRLFKVFSQADTSITRKFGGTGLGLVISDMIAVKMGSKINIDSTPRVGTTFYFDITTTLEDGEMLDIMQITQIKRCLIIDDNANNRLILEGMLCQWQIKCESCENGLEAIKQLKTSLPFDVIICDYNMPYIDGLETIRMIREKLKLSTEKQPIILLHSSSEDAEMHKKCDELGVRFRLSKPVKSNDLFKYLCKLHLNETETVQQKEPEQVTALGRTNHSNNEIKILVAEDIPMNMILIKAILGKLVRGAKIFEATNGLQAVELYKTIAPDLIFMDVQMPELDGHEATRKIRAIEAITGKHIPIIAQTAGALKEEKDKCFATGMDDYLTKPIDTEKTQAVLEKHLAFRNKGITNLLEVNTDDEMHFGYSALSDILGNDMDVMLQLITAAIKSMPIDIEKLEQACCQKDAVKINAAAHSIKGAALSMRFTHMAAIAK